MNKTEKSEIVSQTTDIAFSAVGALVGFAIGGPVGAVAGGAIPPSTKLAIKVGEMWFQRHKIRINNIVKKAFQKSGKSEETILQEMIDCPEWSDTIMSMIKQLVDSDPELDALFSEIIALTISADDEDERNRFILLNNSIKGINKIQLLIIKHIYNSEGVLSANEIAKQIMVPEFELRNAVRDLELRGMIVDDGNEPTVWHIRELGIVLGKTIETFDIMEEKL